MFNRWKNEEKRELYLFYLRLLGIAFSENPVFSTELEEELIAKFPRHSSKSIRKKLRHCKNVTLDDILKNNYHKI